MSASIKTPRKSSEPAVEIAVPKEHVNRILLDRRYPGQQFGSLTECCAQYGIRISTSKNIAVLKAPRSRMQVFLEKLHFSGLPYKIIKKPV